MEQQQRKMKVVYTIVDRGQKSYWVRVGVGFENQDGSLNLKLDAVPTNGTLQVREWEPREDRGDFGGSANKDREPRANHDGLPRFA